MQVTARGDSGAEKEAGLTDDLRRPRPHVLFQHVASRHLLRDRHTIACVGPAGPPQPAGKRRAGVRGRGAAPGTAAASFRLRALLVTRSLKIGSEIRASWLVMEKFGPWGVPMTTNACFLSSHLSHLFLSRPYLTKICCVYTVRSGLGDSEMQRVQRCS